MNDRYRDQHISPKVLSVNVYKFWFNNWLNNYIHLQMGIIFTTPDVCHCLTDPRWTTQRWKTQVETRKHVRHCIDLACFWVDHSARTKQKIKRLNDCNVWINLFSGDGMESVILVGSSTESLKKIVNVAFKKCGWMQCYYLERLIKQMPSSLIQYTHKLVSIF